MEEAGIDGGGIFKDFMENITRAAFDVQYGLFKVSHFFFFSQHKINTPICTYWWRGKILGHRSTCYIYIGIDFGTRLPDSHISFSEGFRYSS